MRSSKHQCLDVPPDPLHLHFWWWSRDSTKAFQVILMRSQGWGHCYLRIASFLLQCLTSNHEPLVGRDVYPFFSFCNNFLPRVGTRQVIVELHCDTLYPIWQLFLECFSLRTVRRKGDRGIHLVLSPCPSCHQNPILTSISLGSPLQSKRVLPESQDSRGRIA